MVMFEKMVIMGITESFGLWWSVIIMADCAPNWCRWWSNCLYSRWLCYSRHGVHIWIESDPYIPNKAELNPTEVNLTQSQHGRNTTDSRSKHNWLRSYRKSLWSLNARVFLQHRLIINGLKFHMIKLRFVEIRGACKTDGAIHNSDRALFRTTLNESSCTSHKLELELNFFSSNDKMSKVQIMSHEPELKLKFLFER